MAGKKRFGGYSYHSFGGPDAVRFYTKRWLSTGVREGATFSFPSAR